MIWKLLFVLTLLGYLIFYAPFGINESDGGFMTGFAWQVLSGKILYGDVLYVRPPLPVWLRAIEIQLLPETWQALGERWIFYLKIAAYCWLAADLLASGSRKWQLATLGFVVSVNGYFPMAMHTFDGILFSVMGLWLLPRSVWFSTLCVFGAMLCKQSFYPMAGVFLGAVFFQNGWRAAAKSAFLLLGCWGAFFGYLCWAGIFDNYQRLVSGSATAGKAFEAGVLAYFRINPMVAVGVAVCLFPVLVRTAILQNRGTAVLGWLASRATILQNRRTAAVGWLAFLCWLSISYVIQVWRLQDCFPPYHQSRLLFWLAGFWVILDFSRSKKLTNLALLLAVSWCASISWGYQCPAQFAMPGVFAAMCFTEQFWAWEISAGKKLGLAVAVWLGLLGTFRYAQDFVFRDGRRSEMTVEMGQVFPQLTGIYSTPETLAMYRELKDLAAQNPGPKCVLPVFGQADYLLKQCPLLPTNWAVNRETNRFNDLIFKTLEEAKPTIFVVKSFGNKLLDDPGNEVMDVALKGKTRVGETAHFWVYR